MSFASWSASLSLLPVFVFSIPATASSFLFDFKTGAETSSVLIWPETGSPRPLSLVPMKSSRGAGTPPSTIASPATKSMPGLDTEPILADEPKTPDLAKVPEKPKRLPVENPRELAQHSKRKPKSAVPAGFEGLLEPQITQVDVYYGGSFLVSTLASFTPTDIKFLHPDQIVSRIPDLLDAEPLLRALSINLGNNSQLVCLRDTQTGCGRIEPELVEVIFDDSQFRADLFIAARLLAIRSALTDKYLPASDAGLSLHQLFNTSLNGVDSDINSYNVGSATTISYKENRLFVQSNYTDTDDFTIDTLALQREFRGREYQAGIFRSIPGNLNFITQRDFAGMRLSSSLDTRNDLDQSTGNDLQVFLSSRSRVDLLKDNRLISSRVYETGNQIIDTTELPGGAYDIELRIRDSQGRITKENRFYTKTNQLPPLDQPLYFFEAGERVLRKPDRTLPQSEGETFIRGGINVRINANFGVEFGTALENRDAVIETGFFRLGRHYDLHTNISASSQGDSGISFKGRVRVGTWAINSSIKKTWASDKYVKASLGEAQLQASINLSAPLDRGTLSISSRYNQRLADDSDRNLGLRFDFNPIRLAKSFFYSNLQLTEDNDNLLLQASFQYRIASGKWRTEVNPQFLVERESDQPGTTDTTASVTSAWQDGDRYLSDVNFSASAIRERTDSSLESTLDIASNLGHLNINNVYHTDQKSHSYAANASTSLLMNKSTFAFGGRSPARSAIVVKIAGDAEDSYFDVLMNQNVRGKARVGDNTVIGLTPYQTYQVRLKARGSSLINFNDSVQSTTLYPGNVVTMNWRSKRVVVVFGQISDHAGNPVSNGLIKGVSGIATTDEFGMFQAELDTKVRKLTVQTREYSCDVDIPDYNTHQNIALLGKLTCR